MIDLRSAALVLLAIAAIDALIDVIEDYTEVNLWQPLLILGIVLLVIDLLIRVLRSERGRRFWGRRESPPETM